MKRYASLILNYAPGLIILVFSMVALSSSVRLIDESHHIRDIYVEHITEETGQAPQLSVLQKTLDQRETWGYWSIVAMGLCGFILTLLNGNKLLQLSRANEQKKEAVAQLEQRIADIAQAEKEKESLRDQLHQAQKLEAIGRLAGGVAHDFNNILAAMNGYAEFLIDDLKEGSSQQGFATNILSAGNQAKELVDSMLAFSRRDRGETRQMNLQDSLNETISMLQASLPKSIELRTEIDETNLPIHGDPTNISQALMNLCVNAKDAMENERGTLTLSLQPADMSQYKLVKTQTTLPATDDMPLVHIEDMGSGRTLLVLGVLAENQPYARLSVADDGSGMSRMVMEHVFEPFFTTKSVDKGTGLGLAMVHGVIGAHRGVLVINSVIDHGTVFDLLFPIVGNVENTEQQQKPEFQEKGTGKVLLVEDQDNVREMMMQMLERLGFEAECCECGVDALEVLREHPDYFDVVLTDQNMPKMSGIELIYQVGFDRPDIPFVLLSGYSQEKMHDLMKEHASVKAILKKPVKRDTLLKTLESVIAERGRTDQSAA